MTFLAKKYHIGLEGTFRDFTACQYVPLQSTMATVSASQTAHGQFASIVCAALASVNTGEPPVKLVMGTLARGDFTSQ